MGPACSVWGEYRNPKRGEARMAHFDVRVSIVRSPMIEVEFCSGRLLSIENTVGGSAVQVACPNPDASRGTNMLQIKNEISRESEGGACLLWLKTLRQNLPKPKTHGQMSSVKAGESSLKSSLKIE